MVVQIELFENEKEGFERAPRWHTELKVSYLFKEL